MSKKKPKKKQTPKLKVAQATWVGVKATIMAGAEVVGVFNDVMAQHLRAFDKSGNLVDESIMFAGGEEFGKMVLASQAIDLTNATFTIEGRVMTQNNAKKWGHFSPKRMRYIPEAGLLFFQLPPNDIKVDNDPNQTIESIDSVQRVFEDWDNVKKLVQHEDTILYNVDHLSAIGEVFV